MAKGVWQATIINEETQNVIPFASVVFRDVDGILITLYADADGTPSPGNPKTADAEGFIRVYFDPNVRVNITATHGGFSRLYKDVISIVESGSANILDGAEKIAQVIYNLKLLVDEDGDDIVFDIRTKNGEIPSTADPVIINFAPAADQPAGGFGGYITRTIDSQETYVLPGNVDLGMSNESPPDDIYVFLIQNEEDGLRWMVSRSPFFNENDFYNFDQSDAEHSQTLGYPSIDSTGTTVRMIGKIRASWDDGWSMETPDSFQTMTRDTDKMKRRESEVFGTHLSTCVASSNNLVYTLRNARGETPSPYYPVRLPFPNDNYDQEVVGEGPVYIDFDSAHVLTIIGAASLGLPSGGSGRLHIYATADENSQGLAVSLSPQDESKTHTVRTLNSSSDSASELYGTDTGSTITIKLLDIIDVAYAGNWTTQPTRKSMSSLDAFSVLAAADLRPRIVWGLVPSVGALDDDKTAISITISPGGYWDGTKLWTLAAPMTKSIHAVFSAGTGNGGVFALGEWGTAVEISKVMNAHLMTNNTTGLLDVVLNRVFDSSRTVSGYTWLCRLCSIPTEEVYYDSSVTLGSVSMPNFYCIQLRDGTLEIQLGWDGVDHNHLIRSHTNPGTEEIAFNNANLLPQNPTHSITHELLVWAKDSTASSQTIIEVFSRLTDRRGGADYETDKKRSGFPDLILGANAGGFSQGQIKLLLTPQYSGSGDGEGLVYRLSQSTTDHQIAIYSNRLWDRRLVQ
jgi:hypothetical protein